MVDHSQEHSLHAGARPQIPVPQSEKQPTPSPDKEEGTDPVHSPSLPPDGGWQAWLQVTGSFCLYFNTWGVVSSFGTFQAIYENGPLQHHTSFEISVIGSLQIFLMVSLGLFVGPIYDAGYFRHLLIAGSFLVVIGILLQSFCVYYWQFIMTQGVIVGLGMGCLSILGVIAPSLWFRSKLPVVNGIAAVGSGLGGVLLPIMVREIDSRAGIGWAARSQAFLSLGLLAFTNIILRERMPSQGKRKIRSLVDMSAFRDPPYLLFVGGCFVTFLGMYTPMVHVQSFALGRSIMTDDLAMYLLTILNSSSIPGRILPSIAAQYIGPMNTIILAAISLSITSFCLMAAYDLGRLLAVVTVYGFFTGTFFASQPTIFVKLTPNPAMVGTRIGMAFATMSVALLFGPSVSGALQDNFGYTVAWIWTGTTISVGTVLIAIARVYKGGFQWSQNI